MSRENLIYQAQLAEQTERFEDMLDFMKQVVKLGGDLSEEERNLLSVAYKNSVGSRRSAWRALSSIEERQSGDGDKAKLIVEYRTKVEKELDKFCYDILSLIDDNLVPQASTSECKVFFLKMKGDYYRYIGEYTRGEDNKKVAQSALEAYNAATELANKDLKTTNPIRLGLALNFSVFYYEVMNDHKHACELGEKALADALEKIDEVDEETFRDAKSIIELLKENLSLWKEEEGEAVVDDL